MATKKEPTEETELKETITPTSPAAEEQTKRKAVKATIQGGSTSCENVDIEYFNPSDEINGIYKGQDLWLTAVLTGGEARENFIFTWSIDGGNFKGTETEVKGSRIETVKDPQTVCIATNAVESPLDVILTATSKIPAVVYTCQKCFPIREPGKADLKGNFDEKMDEVSESIKNTGLKGNFDQKMDKVSESIRSTVLNENFSNKLDDLTEAIKNSSFLNGTVPTLPVALQRSAINPTSDITLWVVIRKSSQAVTFNNYARFMDLVLCGKDSNGSPMTPSTPNEAQASELYRTLRRVRSLPFNDTDAYRLLKTATEAFLLVNGGVDMPEFTFDAADVIDLTTRLGTNSQFTTTGLNNLWNLYLSEVLGTTNPVIPYLALISQKFRNEPLKNQIFLHEPELDGGFTQTPENCMGVLRNKLTRPFLLELIWSYWLEEGMLVQTINAISRRFQNIRNRNGRRDPLAGVEIDPLRPLNNLLWGYVQDEQHRLNIVRRVYEYDHHYGITLQGKAVPRIHPADSRSKFIEAFHHLLYLCSVFFRQDDDTTINSDGFPLLNGLREVHLILSQGAHNQFGDLPSTARQEMLIQQWLLARPEFREFLPTRIMVTYPEPWMDRVDAMKSLQGWTDVSIDHFHRLAVFSEQILLTIRFGAWNDITQSAQSAANWARFWRAEIQGYIHDYRAVTGVDLTASSRVDSTPPSVHLFNRYMAQARR